MSTVAALHAAPRGEGMTDSPPGPVHQPGHRRWSTHLDPHHPSTREPPTFPLRLNSVRRPALASRTFGRFAVDPAGSIPDPNASSRRAQNRRRTARRKIKPGRIPVSELTVPAPSGMTASQARQMLRPAETHFAQVAAVQFDAVQARSRRFRLDGCSTFAPPRPSQNLRRNYLTRRQMIGRR
jgi:hypothetical protein